MIANASRRASFFERLQCQQSKANPILWTTCKNQVSVFSVFLNRFFPVQFLTGMIHYDFLAARIQGNNV
jgi:hypothetical protein